MAAQAGQVTEATGVAARLEEARARAGVTRRWIEDHCGLAHAYFSHMVADPERVRPITLTMVAAALDVSAAWLIHGTGDVQATPLPGYPASFALPEALTGAKALAREKGRSPEAVHAALLKLATADGPNESAKWWYQRLTAEVDGTTPPRRPGRSGTHKVERDRADLDLLAYLELSGPVFAHLVATAPNRLAAAWACVERGRDKRAIRDVLLMKAPDGAADVAGWMRVIEKRQETYGVPAGA